MTSLKIGVVDYLNAYPLWAALESEPQVSLVRGVPSFLAQELQSGRLDAALISSVEYLRQPQGYVYHDSLCIAATRESKSIRLFLPDCRPPFTAALQDVHTIFTDIASRSSVAQLRVILQQLGLTPELQEITNAGERIAALKTGEALLTIGDTALAHLAESSYDMQQVYYDTFQRGFVYALWVMQADREKVVTPLLTAAHRKYNEDIEHYLKLATGRFGFSAEFTHDYLTQTIQHVLSAERKADLNFFAERLAVAAT